MGRSHRSNQSSAPEFKLMVRRLLLYLLRRLLLYLLLPSFHLNYIDGSLHKR